VLVRVAAGTARAGVVTPRTDRRALRGVSACTAAFVQRLRDLGWIGGRTIAIEYRWADGHADRLAEFAVQFRQGSKVPDRAQSYPADPSGFRHARFSSLGRRAALPLQDRP
jgi:hypothetical protein